MAVRSLLDEPEAVAQLMPSLQRLGADANGLGRDLDWDELRHGSVPHHKEGLIRFYL